MFALLLVCAVVVGGGVHCTCGEIKRHVVQDPLIDMYVRQELLLKDIGNTVVGRFGELKSELKSLSDKVAADHAALTDKTNVSDKIVIEKLADLKSEMKLLSDKVAAEHKTLTDKITVSEKTQFEKLAELKGEIKLLSNKGTTDRNLLADKITDSEKKVLDKFAELKGDVKLLSNKGTTEHNTLTGKIAVSDRKIMTLQSEMSQLGRSIKEFKDTQKRDLVKRFTDSDNEIKALLESAFGPEFLKPCPSGYLKNAHGCYKLVSANADWDTAERKCQSDGAYLLSVGTQGEEEALGALMGRHGATRTSYWTGGRRVNGQWRWSGGDQPFTYTNWMPNEPHGTRDCVLFNFHPTYKQHRQTYASSCTNVRFYICEA